MPTHLSFNIPTLDALFAPKGSGHGLPLPEAPNTTSICLIGPDGTGKSVFALHLAYEYCDGLSEQERTKPVRVLYISTDLKLHRAVQVLKNFGKNGKVLTDLSADVSLDSLKNYLSEDRKECEIGFIDLAASTAGDDWGLVNRLLASLPIAEPSDTRHLVVIDAVEGLETMVGDRDAFGLPSTRRQRIANLMRLAEQKAHVVLVVEEAEVGKKHPEEFVADCVLRLRTSFAGNFMRRTLEIEKARALAGYADGQHPFHIGEGSYKNKKDKNKNENDVVEVFPALPSVSDDPDVPQAECPKDNTSLKFELKYLDDMLNEDKGLSPGTIVALIGEASTLKSDLGYYFLAGAFKKRSPYSGLAILFSSDPDSEARLKTAVGTQDQDFKKWAYFKLFPATDLPAAQVYWMIRRYLEDAVNGFTPDDTGSTTFVHRLVIDDLSSFRDTYPEIAEDPLYMPKLVRFLENGIKGENDHLHFFVTVLISTQDGRPGIQTTDRFDESLRNLVPVRIQTWHVQFYDQQRVAISTSTAAHDTGPVVVRELCRRKEGGRTVLNVDPRFELYRDLELGKPERVTLEVRMFSETDSFDRYIESENHLLNELFLPRNPSAPGASVITRVPANQYESLRDFCNMTEGSNSEHTLILQVDEFWDPPKGAFRTQKGYLNVPIITSLETPSDPEEDPMSVFDFGEMCGKELMSRRELAIESNDVALPESEGIRRSDFFVIQGRTRNQPEPDRVPFMWDYGFLLLDRDAWLDAKHRKLDTLSRDGATLIPYGTTKGLTVEDVWKKLRMPTEIRPENPLKGNKDYEPRNLTLDKVVEGRNHISITSWRVFLEATLEVARVARLGRNTNVQAFDVSLISGESISSLILEMWMSEIYLQMRRREVHEPDEVEAGSARDFADKLAAAPRQSQLELSLFDLLKNHRNELYMVFLLLVEVLDFDRVVEPNDPYSFRVRPGADPAVAARHWYKTAVISEEINFKDRPSMPARLPGHFSVRGDWYLAVSAGSRSGRLANLGLDFLNSKRGNIIRLQKGLGLPVRDICPIDEYRGLRTALTYFSEHGGDPQRNRRVTLPYWDLFAELGACSGWLNRPLGRSKDEFNWLWRHRISEYGHHSRIWSNFILSMIRFWRRVRTEEGGSWQSGFDIYDKMYANPGARGKICAPTPDIEKLRSFSGFKWRVDHVISELNWNSRAKD